MGYMGTSLSISCSNFHVKFNYRSFKIENCCIEGLDLITGVQENSHSINLLILTQLLARS